MSNAAPVEGEVTSVEGWLTYYCEEDKSWKPIKGKVSIYLDGIKIGEADANEYGIYSFKFIAPYAGKHKLEVKFPGSERFEGSYKLLEFQSLTKKAFLKISKMAKIVAVVVFLLILLSLLSVFLVKFFSI
ncbi:MAG: hypothetical protein QXE86_03055 [Archaeoglobaceae archaeon]